MRNHLQQVWTFLPALFVLAILGFYLHATLRGKFLVWAELLDKVGLRSDERILDLGCGRGAVLLMAAQHLTTGRAVGVDLWRSVDQSGNAAEATRRNAIAEGVADRVELHTADMTALPFEDNSFDVVVSSLAIHNISGSAGREKAVDETVRVLCPGGRLLIADIPHS
jgi:ubiquinone/menaquinone biosynthesis C-methylase UbiE